MFQTPNSVRAKPTTQVDIVLDPACMRTDSQLDDEIKLGPVVMSSDVDRPRHMVLEGIVDGQQA